MYTFSSMICFRVQPYRYLLAVEPCFNSNQRHVVVPVFLLRTHHTVRLKCAPKRQNKEDVFINSVFTAFGFKYEGQSVNLEKEVISMEGSIRRMTAMMESQNGTIESMQHAMLMAAQRQEENMLRLQNEIASLKRTTRVS